MDAIDGQVKGSEATGKETPPPPVVILCTQVEVAEQDGGLRAGDDENEEYDE